MIAGQLLYTKVAGHSIAYRRAGTGPPLVLLHGFLCDSRCWRTQLAGLADQFTLIAWDAPGLGERSQDGDGARDVPPPDKAQCSRPFGSPVRGHGAILPCFRAVGANRLHVRFGLQPLCSLESPWSDRNELATSGGPRLTRTKSAELVIDPPSFSATLSNW